MSNTPNLDITLVETQQLQPEVTMNSGILAFERAITESAEIECVDGLNSVTAEDAREHIHLRLIDGSPGTSAAFTVELPAVKRMLALTNSTDYDATIVCADAATGAAEAVLPSGETRTVICDGTQVRGMSALPSGLPLSGNAGKILIVSDSEEGVAAKSAREFALEINAQSGTTYELALSDAGKLVTFDSATSVTVTIPEDATTDFPVGTQVLLAQLDAGQVTAVGESTSVTIVSPETTALAKTGATASIIKIAADTWLMAGNLEAA